MLRKALAVTAILALMAVPAMALEGPTALQESKAGTTESSKYLGLALAFALGGAAIGGALGQSNAIGKAVDAVARQPEAGARIQGMMIIGLALIETLVIYVLLICFVWGGRVV